jgi:hypothetical protein
MKKPIGFRSYQNDEGPDKRDELEKQQAERQKAIANFIGQNYSPIGTTSQKCYKTTAELVYELSNIVDVAPMALAKQLSDAGYHVEYLAGQPLLGDVRESINSCGCTSFCTNLYKSVQPHLFDK